jgi:hypothetical protein
MARGNFLRVLRQVTLITVLVMFAAGTLLTRQRSTSWQEPLWVTVYPIANDHADNTLEYIADLNRKTFAPIERFMASEAKRYGLSIEQPVRMELGRPIDSLPPAPPESGNPISVGLWSLKLRWWASQATKNQPGPTPDIRLFLVYHDPEHVTSVPHSLGLQKGLLGVAHLYASDKQTGSGNMIIAHEMLHTLGATDKYAPGSNLPRFPDGYADPDRTPLYPQTRAEIMGGRIPVSETEADIPASLKKTVVGPATAAEIRWLETDS